MSHIFLSNQFNKVLKHRQDLAILRAPAQKVACSALKKNAGILMGARCDQFDWEMMNPTERRAYLNFMTILPKGPITNALFHEHEIAQKSGHMWECFDYESGIYAFRLKRPFDPTQTDDADAAFEEEQKRISPAVEMTYKSVQKRFSTKKADNTILSAIELPSSEETPKEMSMRDAYKKYGLKLFSSIYESDYRVLTSLIYEELGYQFKEGVLYIPDVETLQIRWAKLQEKYPGLSDLNLLVVTGISTDEAFFQGNIIYTAILSDDKEFLHDQTIHVTAQIQLLALLAGKGINFENYKYSIARDLLLLYQRILIAESKPNFLSPMEIAMLKSSLGARVDMIAAQQEQVNLSSFSVVDILNTKDFRRLAVEKFGEKALKRLPDLWKQLKPDRGL